MKFIRMVAYIICIPKDRPNTAHDEKMETFAEQYNRPFSTGQLSAFIIQLVTWQVLTRSERKNKISCNKNAIKITEMLENYIYCIPIKKLISVLIS